jgi:hypothetical protein
MMVFSLVVIVHPAVLEIIFLDGSGCPSPGISIVSEMSESSS